MLFLSKMLLPHFISVVGFSIVSFFCFLVCAQLVWNTSNYSLALTSTHSLHWHFCLCALKQYENKIIYPLSPTHKEVIQIDSIYIMKCLRVLRLEFAAWSSPSYNPSMITNLSPWRKDKKVVNILFLHCLKFKCIKKAKW